MTMEKLAAHEEPVYFHAHGEDLFGVLTHPSGEALGTAIVLLSGGAFVPSFNRNRTWVKLARKAASLGYHSLRIDYRGVGESSGSVEDFVLGEPFVEDLSGGLAVLGDRGIDNIVLIGSCFGARVCLAAAAQVEQLVGLALVSSPVIDKRIERGAEAPFGIVLQRVRGVHPVRGLLRFDRPHRQRQARHALGALARACVRRGIVARGSSDEWVSTSFLSSLEHLGKKRVPTLLAYGAEDGPFQSFEAARAGRLGKVLERAESAIRIEVVPGQLHAFTSLAAQDTMQVLLVKWLSELASTGASA